MIRLILTGVKWGTDDISEVNPDTLEEIRGSQLNLFDEQSGILVSVPFTGDPLKNLIAELVKGLTDDQRRELAPHFQSGLMLPQIPGVPHDAGTQLQRGAQG